MTTAEALFHEAVVSKLSFPVQPDVRAESEGKCDSLFSCPAFQTREQQQPIAILKGGMATPPLPYAHGGRVPVDPRDGSVTPKEREESGALAATAALLRCLPNEDEEGGTVPPPPQPWVGIPSAGHEAGAPHPAPVSVGTFGHPHTCANPCRYVKRKGGCRDGAACTMCHVCFWRREPGREAAGQEMGCQPCGPEAQPVSLGTMGHPFTCAAPCRHAGRRGGCKDGVLCERCHECKWTRTAERQFFVAGTEKCESAAKTLEALIRLQLYTSQKDGEGEEVNDSNLKADTSKAANPNLNATPVEAAPTATFKAQLQVRQKISLDAALTPPPEMGSREPMMVPLPGDESAIPTLPADPLPQNALRSAFTGGEGADQGFIKGTPAMVCAPSSPRGDMPINVGTVGHPHRCGRACKYNSKPKGCKDGLNCSRCHLCKWRRADELKYQALVAARAG